MGQKTHSVKLLTYQDTDAATCKVATQVPSNQFRLPLSSAALGIPDLAALIC
jgi:hypothetical protein